MAVPAKLRFLFFFVVTAPVLLLGSTQNAAFSAKRRNGTSSCDCHWWGQDCLIAEENDVNVALDPYPEIKAIAAGPAVTPSAGNPGKAVFDNCSRVPYEACVQAQKNMHPVGETCSICKRNCNS